MSEAVFDQLQARLTQAGVVGTVLRHEPVFTSEQAAARPWCSTMSSGAKALILKAGGGFVMAVVPADRKLDSKKARAALGVKELAFLATREEVEQLTSHCNRARSRLLAVSLI